MKYGKGFLYGALLISALGFSVVATGCKSSGNKMSNPFAKSSQTVPPPATFSHQSSYLGQTPGGYTPQVPATVYPQSTIPGTIPANVPLPSGTVVPTTPTPYSGSINGASVYQNGVPSAQVASTAAPVAADWQAASPVPEASISATPTSQTASQFLASKVGTVTTVSADGRSQVTVTAPETLVVSSSQAITKISGDAEPAPHEPQPLYTAW